MPEQNGITDEGAAIVGKYIDAGNCDNLLRATLDSAFTSPLLGDTRTDVQIFYTRVYRLLSTTQQDQFRDAMVAFISNWRVITSTPLSLFNAALISLRLGFSGAPSALAAHLTDNSLHQLPEALRDRAIAETIGLLGGFEGNPFAVKHLVRLFFQAEQLYPRYTPHLFVSICAQHPDDIGEYLPRFISSRQGAIPESWSNAVTDLPTRIGWSALYRLLASIDRYHANELISVLGWERIFAGIDHTEPATVEPLLDNSIGVQKLIEETIATLTPSVRRTVIRHLVLTAKLAHPYSDNFETQSKRQRNFLPYTGNREYLIATPEIADEFFEVDMLLTRSADAAPTFLQDFRRSAEIERVNAFRFV